MEGNIIHILRSFGEYGCLAANGVSANPGLGYNAAPIEGNFNDAMMQPPPQLAPMIGAM